MEDESAGSIKDIMEKKRYTILLNCLSDCRCEDLSLSFVLLYIPSQDYQRNGPVHEIAISTRRRRASIKHLIKTDTCSYLYRQMAVEQDEF